MSNQAVLFVGEVPFVVNQEDLGLVSAYRWHLFDNGRGHRYAQTSVRLEKDGRRVQRKLRLHRLILGLGFGDSRMVDHINGDTTDNRRENLRVADIHINNVNRARKHGGPMKTKDGWIVRTYFNGARQYHGFFKSHEAALSVFRSVIGDEYAR